MKTEYCNILFSYAGQRSHVDVLAQGILGKWSVPYSVRPRRYANDSFCAAVKPLSVPYSVRPRRYANDSFCAAVKPFS